MKYILIAFAFVFVFGTEAQAQPHRARRHHQVPIITAEEIHQAVMIENVCQTVVVEWRCRTHNGTVCPRTPDTKENYLRCLDSSGVHYVSLRIRLRYLPEPYVVPWEWDHQPPTLFPSPRRSAPILRSWRSAPPVRLDVPPQTDSSWTGWVGLLILLGLIVVVLPLALFRVMQLKHENWSLKQSLTEAKFRQDDLGPFRR